MITIQEKVQSIRDESEHNREQIIDELKSQIRRLEEAYSHIEDARHEIRHAFIESNEADKSLVEKDFDEPLRWILEDSQKGLDNFIKILEAELVYVKRNHFVKEFV